MVKPEDKREVLGYIEKMENRWKQEKERLLKDKRKLLKEIRELKKEMEVLKNTNELQIEIKDEELKLIKEMVGGKVKYWDDMYGKLQQNKKELEEKVGKLEGNLSLTMRDGTSRIDLLKQEKENIIKELNIEHQKAMERLKDKMTQTKQEELKKEIKNVKSQMEKEMDEIIRNQKAIWEEEVRKKEEEITEQRKKMQDELTKQRVELEKREKEYLKDLLEKFKKS